MITFPALRAGERKYEAAGKFIIIFPALRAGEQKCETAEQKTSTPPVGRGS
jgi:hypothetical protein